MTCDSVSKLIPLYFYGELSPDEEDRVEQHLDGCAACSREMDRQRAMCSAVDPDSRTKRSKTASDMSALGCL